MEMGLRQEMFIWFEFHTDLRHFESAKNIYALYLQNYWFGHMHGENLRKALITKWHLKWNEFFTKQIQIIKIWVKSCSSLYNKHLIKQL